MTWRSVMPLLLPLWAGCAAPAASPQPSDTKVIEVLIKAGHPRITLDADGAAKLRAATSCNVEFVRPETGALALFRIRTTRAQPELARCVDAVRAVPGIAFVQENVTVKSVR